MKVTHIKSSDPFRKFKYTNGLHLLIAGVKCLVLGKKDDIELVLEYLYSYFMINKYMEFENQKEFEELLKLGIEQGQYPRTLYQFKPLTEYTEKIFNNNELYFSSIKKFNDPFEGKFIHDVDYENFEVYLYLYGLYFKKQIPSQDISMLATNMINNKTSTDSNNLEIMNNILTKSGIGCFVSDFNNLLMWSHYANSHKGICIEYDILESPSTFVAPIPMEYSNKYPKLNYIRNQHDFLEKTICRKSTEWSYEDEFRILKREEGTYSIKKEAIKSISFGVKCDEQDKIRLVKILKINGYNHVKIYQCLLSQRSFELERKDITNEIFSRI